MEVNCGKFSKIREFVGYLHSQKDALDIYYLHYWLPIALIIGVVAGIGAIAFYEAIHWSTVILLGKGAGFIPPAPAGEGTTMTLPIARRWMIPVITTLGGLISGLIVVKFAPEAEGHGTDAAIDAFHHKEGLIRARVPLIKMLASAITIGSGGSAGREGPTAQIAAGFGSLLSQILRLSPRDRRIAMATGIGAGIGAIFKAPLGGALLSTEILYLEGFEVEALIPSFIASVVGYTVFATWNGYDPVFGWNPVPINWSADPVTLIFYACMGLACGLIGIIYTKTFYGTRKLIRMLRIPKVAKPALGGLAVGLIGSFFPQVLGMGYGWLQLAMHHKAGPLEVLLLLVFGKILATSLSIGSGGSGGVFAPGLFIGGMFGASMWEVLHRLTAHVPASPEPFIVVGMMSLFGAVAHAPLAVMIMVGEMTGSYTLLIPAMIATGIAYVTVGKNTIYESQVATPIHSPAHRDDYHFPLLERFQVRDAMVSATPSIGPEATVFQALELIRSSQLKALPVVSNNTLIGIISLEDVIAVTPQNRRITTVGSVMSTELTTVGPEDGLDVALQKMAEKDLASLPVVDGEGTMVGLVQRRDIARNYLLAARRLIDSNQNPGLQPLFPRMAEKNRKANPCSK